MNVRLYVQYLSFKSLNTAKNIVFWNVNKEGVAKETLIGLAPIRYACSNLLYMYTPLLAGESGQQISQEASPGLFELPRPRRMIVEAATAESAEQRGHAEAKSPDTSRWDCYIHRRRFYVGCEGTRFFPTHLVCSGCANLDTPRGSVSNPVYETH